MSQFTFLQREWAAVFAAASKAEAGVHADPRTACFYARRALELAVSWAFKHDAGLRLPYQDNLSALIHEPSFKQAAGEAVFSKARVINMLSVVSMRDINRPPSSARNPPPSKYFTGGLECSYSRITPGPRNSAGSLMVVQD